MNDPDDWVDHSALLEDGFSRFTVQTLVEAGACIGYAEIAGGESGSTELIAAEDFSYPLADGEKVTFALPKPGFVYAPVVAGQSAGVVYICVDGNPVGKLPVEFGMTVEQKKRPKPGLLEKIFGERNQ